MTTPDRTDFTAHRRNSQSPGATRCSRRHVQFMPRASNGPLYTRFAKRSSVIALGPKRPTGTWVVHGTCIPSCRECILALNSLAKPFNRVSYSKCGGIRRWWLGMLACAAIRPLFTSTIAAAQSVRSANVLASAGIRHGIELSGSLSGVDPDSLTRSRKRALPHGHTHVRAASSLRMHPDLGVLW